MTKGVYLLSTGAFEKIYGPSEREDIARLMGHSPPHYEAERVRAEPGLLADVEVVLGGWGTPRFEGPLLQAAGKLRVILYGAGSIRGTVSDGLWDRGVLITSAAAANGLPVAEYTLAAILMS